MIISGKIIQDFTPVGFFIIFVCVCVGKMLLKCIIEEALLSAYCVPGTVEATGQSGPRLPGLVPALGRLTVTGSILSPWSRDLATLIMVCLAAPNTS